MKKFVAIYMAPVGSFDNMAKASPEEQKKGMESWEQWMKKNKKMFVDEGHPATRNIRVTKDGLETVRNEICGYSVVQAQSHEDAAKIFQDNPMMETPGAFVEVLELMPM